MSIIKKLYKGLGNVTFHGIAVGGMELARGIEPPTCGLQISHRGVAQVIEDLGNPATVANFPAFPYSSQCSLFSSFYRQLSRFLTP